MANFMMIQLMIWQLLMAMPARHRDLKFNEGRCVGTEDERHHLVAEDVVLGLDHHLHAEDEHHDAVDLDLRRDASRRDPRAASMASHAVDAISR